MRKRPRTGTGAIHGHTAILPGTHVSTGIPAKSDYYYHN